MNVRHGDVQLIKVDKLPKRIKHLEGRKELAYGKVTGHAHRIDFGDLFETEDGKLYLKVDQLANLSHEQHKTKIIEPGIYSVHIKRQHTPTGWENVRD